jgi:hypothetical protein
MIQDKLPHVPLSAGYVLVVYCCFVMAISALLTFSPGRFFSRLSFGRPVPKLLEKPWIVTAYRLFGIGAFIFFFRILIRALRP